MAAEGKKSVTVKRVLTPFLEAPGKKAPPWLDAIPKAKLTLDDISIERKMELDMRKWKVPDISNGIYAIARYELKTFATVLAKHDKEVMAAVPKEQLKGANWSKLVKEAYANRQSPLRGALDNASKTLGARWKTIAQEIENKVSLALDEVEADTGDNKKAIASAKESFKKFERLEKEKMLEGPTKDLRTALEKFRAAVTDEDLDAKAKAVALKEVEKLVSAAEGSFNASAKKMNEVVKYFYDTGKNMAGDTKANAAFQSLGTAILKEKASLKGLEDAVDKLEDQITQVKNLVKKEDAKEKTIDDQLKKLAAIASGQNGLANQAGASVMRIKKLFEKAKKEVKG